MRFVSRHKRHLRSSDGQSMVEFALCLPFLFLILVSILYFGRYFLLAQVLLYAAQEGAKVAARTPNLSDSTTRDSVRGFTTGGAQSNTNSVIYTALASAHLLSQSSQNSSGGNLPSGGSIQILPWDATGTSTVNTPAGTVQVVINYPFQLLGNPFTGASEGSVNGTLAVAMSFTGPALQFPNFTITEQSTAAQEVYQQ